MDAETQGFTGDVLLNFGDHGNENILVHRHPPGAARLSEYQAIVPVGLSRTMLKGVIGCDIKVRIHVLTKNEG